MIQNRWHLKGEPKAVMRRAFELARPRTHLGLWMEQGLAKTTTALNLFLDKHLSDEVDTLFVLTKKSLRYNWKDEAEKWGFNIPFTIRERDGWDGPMPAPGKPRVLVGYYENLHLESAFDAYMKAASQSGRVMMVADESQAIKNYASKPYQKFHELNMLCDHANLLSGTPQAQNPLDWWPQLRSLKAIKGVTPIQFKLKYCKMGGFKGKQIMGVNEDNLADLQRLISESGFVASKKDWAADLPDKTFETIRLEMPPELLKHYRSMELEFYAELSETEFVTANMVISALLKLQQISSGFIINENKKPIDIVKFTDIPKVQALKDLIEGSTSKIIVFTHFRYSTEALRTALSEYDPCALIGQMQGEDLQKEVRKFNEGKSRVMIAQVSVGGTGHTMLGNEGMPCHTTVFYENSFSLIARSQAEDRNHRFGQKNAVTYYDFVSSGVEQRIIDALQKKKDLVETVVGIIRDRPQ